MYFVILIGALFFLFLVIMMLAFLEGGKQAEMRFPSQRLEKWEKESANIDSIIAILGNATKKNGRIIGLDDNIICIFQDNPNVKIGDNVIISGYVLDNGEKLYLCDCKVLSSSDDKSEVIANLY